MENFLILKYSRILRIIIFLVLKFLLFFNLSKIRKTEKTKTYECGYLPFVSRLKPNSRNFLPIMLLFLLVDAEIIFLLPYFLTNPHLLHIEAHLSIHFFIFLLIINYIIEIKSKIFKK